MSVNITEKRIHSDRRNLSNYINRFIFIGGRRKTRRREEDKQRHFPLDLYSPRLLFVLLSILLLSCVDAYLTIALVEQNFVVEANPMMGFHLERGVLPFIINKFFLTAGSIIILCLFHNNNIARKGIIFILIVYTAVITYQLYLAHILLSTT